MRYAWIGLALANLGALVASVWAVSRTTQTAPLEAGPDRIGALDARVRMLETSLSHLLREIELWRRELSSSHSSESPEPSDSSGDCDVAGEESSEPLDHAPPSYTFLEYADLTGSEQASLRDSSFSIFGEGFDGQLGCLAIGGSERLDAQGLVVARELFGVLHDLKMEKVLASGDSLVGLELSTYDQAQRFIEEAQVDDSTRRLTIEKSGSQHVVVEDSQLAVQSRMKIAKLERARDKLVSTLAELTGEKNWQSIWLDR